MSRQILRSSPELTKSFIHTIKEMIEAQGWVRFVPDVYSPLRTLGRIDEIYIMHGVDNDDVWLCFTDNIRMPISKFIMYPVDYIRIINEIAERAQARDL